MKSCQPIGGSTKSGTLVATKRLCTQMWKDLGKKSSFYACPRAIGPIADCNDIGPLRFVEHVCFFRRATREDRSRPQVCHSNEQGRLVQRHCKALYTAGCSEVGSRHYEQSTLGQALKLRGLCAEDRGRPISLQPAIYALFPDRAVPTRKALT